MSTVHGTCLSHPIRPDNRGTLAVVSAPRDLIAEQILSLVETRVGERVMVPDFGLPDFLFSLRGANFAAVFGHLLKQQVAKYVPGVERVAVTELDAGDEHAARIQVEWAARGSNVPHNLVFPTRRLRGL